MFTYMIRSIYTLFLIALLHGCAKYRDIKDIDMKQLIIDRDNVLQKIRNDSGDAIIPPESVLKIPEKGNKSDPNSK